MKKQKLSFIFFYMGQYNIDTYHTNITTIHSILNHIACYLDHFLKIYSMLCCEKILFCSVVLL